MQRTGNNNFQDMLNTAIIACKGCLSAKAAGFWMHFPSVLNLRELTSRKTSNKRSQIRQQNCLPILMENSNRNIVKPT